MPALSFMQGANDNSELNLIKFEMTKETPVTLNLSVDDMEFEKLQDVFKNIIVNKNKLAHSDDVVVKNLCHDLNSFSSTYEKMGLVPVNLYLDNVITVLEDYTITAGKNVVFNTYWGKAKFLYYKLNMFESYFHSLLELIVDYQLNNQSQYHVNIKTDLQSSRLQFSVDVNIEDVDFMQVATDAVDHRVSKIIDLSKKLGIKANKVSNEINSFHYTYDLPIKFNVNPAFLIEVENKPFFIKEDDLIEFVNISSHELELIDDVYYFLKDTEQYPVMNFENTRVGDKFIGAIMGKGAIPFVCLVDKVGEVEQVVITGLDEKLENDFIDGQVEYGEKLIPVINNCPSWAVDLSKKVAS
ncbi:MAG: hypothetical protein HON90_15150 [Halobacteriovoraceae bacterium]|nr:hypothetical protein [Halobacteriovoraceae bacterium]